MSKRTRKANQRKRHEQREMNLAHLKIRELWDDSRGICIEAFARKHQKVLFGTERMHIAFFKDMLQNRLKLDIQPLVPDELNPVTSWIHADSLEDALTQYGDLYVEDKFLNAVWMLPETGIWGEIRNLCKDLKAQGPESQKAERLLELLTQIEDDVETQGDLKYDEEEKFVSTPIGGKGMLSEKFTTNTALVPHGDTSIVLLFLWQGRGTLLYKQRDLHPLRIFGHAYPVKTGPIKAYEVPEFSLLIMASNNFHSANIHEDPSYFGRSISRAFMKLGDRIKYNIHLESKCPDHPRRMWEKMMDVKRTIAQEEAGYDLA